MRKTKQAEEAFEDNPLYHNTWKLLSKYRDVVWSLEPVSYTHLQIMLLHGKEEIIYRHIPIALLLAFQRDVYKRQAFRKRKYIVCFVLPIFYESVYSP